MMFMMCHSAPPNTITYHMQPIIKQLQQYRRVQRNLRFLALQVADTVQSTIRPANIQSTYTQTSASQIKAELFRLLRVERITW